ADVARALALLPTDAAAARAVLQQSKLPDDRALGLFSAWRDAGDAAAAAIAAVLRGERGRELSQSVSLPAADSVPAAFAHALAALAGTQPDRQQEHWKEALSQPFDAELVLPCVATAADLGPLPALLAQCDSARAGGAPLPPAFAAALRLCAR